MHGQSSVVFRTESLPKRHTNPALKTNTVSHREFNDSFDHTVLPMTCGGPAVVCRRLIDPPMS